MSIDMDQIYSYTKTVNKFQLADEISAAGLSAPDLIEYDGITVQIYYPSALSSGDETTLDSVIANHVANSNYVTIAAQAQITQFTNYINSGTQSVAATARAQLIAAIGPKLDPATLTMVNAAIKGIVGF